MNYEIMAAKQKLAEFKAEQRQLELEASNLITSIRITVTPYIDSASELDTDKALSAITKLDEIKKRLDEIAPKIKQMEQDLK